MIAPGDRAQASSAAVAARADFCGPPRNGVVLWDVPLLDIPRQTSPAFKPTRAIAATHSPSAAPSPAMQQPKLLDHLREIRAFLTHPGVKEKVSASTQNQALSALLFLYRYLLGREVGDLGDVVRARKPRHLPTIMTGRRSKPVSNALTARNGGCEHNRDIQHALCIGGHGVRSPVDAL